MQRQNLFYDSSTDVNHYVVFGTNPWIIINISESSVAVVRLLMPEGKNSMTSHSEQMTNKSFGDSKIIIELIQEYAPGICRISVYCKISVACFFFFKVIEEFLHCVAPMSASHVPKAF